MGHKADRKADQKASTRNGSAASRHTTKTNTNLERNFYTTGKPRTMHHTSQTVVVPSPWHTTKATVHFVIILIILIYSTALKKCCAHSGGSAVSTLAHHQVAHISHLSSTSGGRTYRIYPHVGFACVRSKQL